MDDDGCVTDLATLNNNLEFLYRLQANNGICPIDLGLDVSQGEEGLAIVDFDPKVEDDSSDDDHRGDELSMHLQQACGDSSNAAIEQLWIANARPGKSTKTNKAEIRKKYDELRALAVSKFPEYSPELPELGQANPEKEPEVPDKRQKLKPKKRRRKFKNVAIESILGIRETGTTEAASTSSQNSGMPPPAPMSSNGLSHGRSRGASDNLRKGMSMIRPECIHGYNANTDYKPIDSDGNLPALRDEYPPL